MLARPNRITRGADYKTTVRRGRRVVGANTVCYLRPTGDEETRFGFVVSKSVGIAVVRNRVRRRLKAICFQALEQHPFGVDLVIRALPGSAKAQWVTLQEEIFRAMSTVIVQNSIGKGGALS